MVIMASTRPGGTCSTRFFGTGTTGAVACASGAALSAGPPPTSRSRGSASPRSAGGGKPVAPIAGEMAHPFGSLVGWPIQPGEVVFDQTGRWRACADGASPGEHRVDPRRSDGYRRAGLERLGFLVCPCQGRPVPTTLPPKELRAEDG